MLEKIKFEKFTAFEKLEVKFSPGINIFVGENGTGKTHILKAAYAACEIAKSKGGFAEKVNNVFYPSGKQIGRLVKRPYNGNKGTLEVFRNLKNGKEISLRLSFGSNTVKPENATISGSTKAWLEYPIEVAYIPVKDMMANAPGFRSLYDEREIHFEEVYADIIRKAFLPARKELSGNSTHLLKKLQEAMGGKIVAKNEEFFLRNKQGELEFTLLAEGFRKLGLIWVLIQTGTLVNGSVLFWDEPETNLNPKLMRSIVSIMLELQRIGVQIFLTTHDYVILKEFDLQTRSDDNLKFHSLYRCHKSENIDISTTTNYLDISHNAIDDTFGDLVTREISKSLNGA